MHKQQRLRIAFLSYPSPFFYKNWSGILAKQFELLSKSHDVEWLGKVNAGWVVKFKVFILKLLFKKILRKNLPSHYKIRAKALGKLYSTKVNNGHYDLVFAPASTECLAFLETKLPIIYFCDATPELLINYYPSYKNVPLFYAKDMHFLEKKCIDKAAHIIYTSTWAKKSGVDFYGANENKISIIPFPPSLPAIPSTTAIQNKKKSAICKLLFLAANWERKGGDLVLNTWLSLKEKGLKCELTVVGCAIPDSCKRYINQKDFIYYRRLNKNNTEDWKILQDIFLQTDFLHLPTRADCTPVVFSEANAFGIIPVSCDTGGVTGVISHMVNGIVLPYNAGHEDYARSIYDIFSNQELFDKLRNSALQYFHDNFSESKWAIKMNENLKKCFQ